MTPLKISAQPQLHRLSSALSGLALFSAAALSGCAPAACPEPGLPSTPSSTGQPAVAPVAAVEAEQPTPASLPEGALDAMLTGYEYPYPVQHFVTTRQGVELDMAYMVVEPRGDAAKADKQAAVRTVTLLHGKNFSGAYWKTTADQLADKGFRVVIPDQIGFGKSSKPVGFQYSFQELAQLTRELLTKIGVSESVIVGHSMGGMLATRFALMYPETTKQLVLVNPIGLEDWKRVVPYHSVDDWKAANLKATPDSVREYMKKSYFDGQWKAEYDPLVTIQAGWAIGPDRELIAQVSAEHYHMIFTQPVVDEFKDLKVPTLLVIGQRDTTAIGKAWVSPEVAKTLGRYPELGRKAKAAIPKAQLVEIQGIGHVPQLESFDKWMKALLGFVK